MKLLLRALLVLTLVLLLAAAAGGWWFYFYSGDIPNFEALVSLDPDVQRPVACACAEGPVVAIPLSLMGENVPNAVRAAEGEDRILAMQIARHLMSGSKMRNLDRLLFETKAAVQIRRRFSSEQILTIYLNLAYFGDKAIGIEAASQHYFGKSPSQLDLAEAAMLAGLLRAPTLYSPTLHPERAKARRDAVIGKMVQAGAITQAEGNAAISKSLD